MLLEVLETLLLDEGCLRQDLSRVIEIEGAEIVFAQEANPRLSPNRFDIEFSAAVGYEDTCFLGASQEAKPLADPLRRNLGRQLFLYK